MTFDWIDHPAILFGSVFFYHLLVMQWSVLTSFAMLMPYKALVLIGIGLNPQWAFSPDMINQSQWVLVQTGVIILIIAALSLFHWLTAQKITKSKT